MVFSNAFKASSASRDELGGCAVVAFRVVGSVFKSIDDFMINTVFDMNYS